MPGSQTPPDRWRVCLLVLLLVAAASGTTLTALDQALVDAAKAGDTAAMRTQLEAGASASTVNDKGTPVLVVAAFLGHQAAVELLLDRGAGVDEHNTKNLMTALIAASSGGHPGVVKLLLQRGANIKARDAMRLTPLGHASAACHQEVAGILLDHGANWRWRVGPDFHSPLMIAALAGCEEVARVLLDHGAHIEDISRYNERPLLFAAKADRGGLPGGVRVAKLLLARGADPTVHDYFGRTAMDMARSQEFRTVVQRGLQAWALRKCEEKAEQGAGDDCAVFVLELQQRVLEKRGELIERGLEARRQIASADSEEAAAPIRKGLYASAVKLLTVPGSNSAQEVLARDVAFDWRARVLCHAEQAKRTLDETYEDFLCVELPKMRTEAAKEITKPLLQAIETATEETYDWDTKKDGEHFDEVMGVLRKRFDVSSRRLGGGRARRLLGSVGGFCAAASDTGLWEAAESGAGAAASTRLARLIDAPSACVAAGCLAAASALLSLGLAARRCSSAELKQADEDILE